MWAILAAALRLPGLQQWAFLSCRRDWRRARRPSRTWTRQKTYLPAQFDKRSLLPCQSLSSAGTEVLAGRLKSWSKVPRMTVIVCQIFWFFLLEERGRGREMGRGGVGVGAVSKRRKKRKSMIGVIALHSFITIKISSPPHPHPDPHPHTPPHPPPSPAPLTQMLIAGTHHGPVLIGCIGIIFVSYCTVKRAPASVKRQQDFGGPESDCSRIACTSYLPCAGCQWRSACAEQGRE